MRGTAFLRKKETRSFLVRRTDEEKVRHEFQKIKKKVSAWNIKEQKVKNETAEFTQNAILLAIKRLLMSPIAAVVCK